MELKVDEWVVYRHESDPNGADFEYMLSGSRADLDHDDGCLKVRRRVRGVLEDPDKPVTTHGRRFRVPEWVLETEERESLLELIDQYTEHFLLHYDGYTLQWGKYVA